MMAVKIIVFNPKGAEETLAGLKKQVFQRKNVQSAFLTHIRNHEE